MYKHFNQKSITDFSEASVESEYGNGYVFTRLGRGVMQQIKSLRVDLSEFELSSENRRVLNKNENLKLEHKTLPLKNYSWEIGKLAKDFYDVKGGEGTMSVNKIKEIFTDIEKSNMNSVFEYSFKNNIIGYCLCYNSKNIIHYSYPFYKLPTSAKATADKQVISYKLPNLGMTQMLQAILWAKANNKKYIYLGSDNKYKHQFKGLELFDGQKWAMT